MALEVEGARLEIGRRARCSTNGDLWLERGEHVSLVGPNGAGKTTLIEAIAGNRELDAGRVRARPQREARLPHPALLRARLHRHRRSRRPSAPPACRPGKARALLGRFLFSGDEAEKPLDGLSGGERRRLSLAILVASDANVLILDEPTNHLDLDAREALEDALTGFGGALLLVSHDRALLDAVGTRTVALEDGALRSYEGGWAEYLRAREERSTAPAERQARPRRSRERSRRRPGPPRTRAGGSWSSSARSSAPRPRCASSRTSWPTPRAGARRTLTGESAERHAAAKRAVEEAYARWEEATAANGGSEP